MKTYEKPCIEVLEFDMKDSIASSAANKDGVALFEDFWGLGGIWGNE